MLNSLASSKKLEKTMYLYFIYVLDYIFFISLQTQKQNRVFVFAFY